MQILHCISAMVGGGVERQLTFLAAGQRQQGDAVDVALVSGGPNLERLENSGATIHFIPARGNHDPMIAARLVRLIRRLRPDVVHTWLTQMDVLAGIAARLCGVPTVLSEGSSERNYPDTLKNRLRARIGKGAGAVVCNSVGGIEYWRALGGPASLSLIPYALPLDERDRANPVNDAELGVSRGEKVVLFVGRLAPEKNLENLIPALAIASESASFVAFLCGEGDKAGTLRLIEKHGLQSRVRLIGYVPSAWAWLKRADVFVSVSRHEGRPTTVLEAVACGCPVVLSDIPAHREMLDETTAVYAAPDSPSDIAAGIVGVLEGPGVARERAARAMAQSGPPSVADIARAYREIYSSIVSAGRAAV